MEQEIQQRFLQLASNMDSSSREAALQRANQILSECNGSLDVVQDVLESEVSRSFFWDRHFKQTVSKKQRFDFELSELMCRILGAAFPREPFRGSGILQPLDPSAAADARTQLTNDGFVVLPHRLDASACDQIVESLEQIEFRVKATGEFVQGYQSQDVEQIHGNTCWVLDQQKILQIPQVQQLVSDPTVLNLVQDYLGCIPIHNQTNCWWTINHQTSQRSMKSDAQLFHQDKSFIRFVKVFIYLNDVTDENGPHTYIRGSARDYDRHVPSNYSVSQRLDDEFLRNEYAPDRFVTMRGERGTIVLEDTSGFHKGTPVLAGHRLMLQLEYCCSLYFNPGISFSYEGLTRQYTEFAKQHPRMFMNYDNDRYLSYIQRKRKQLNTARMTKKIQGIGDYLWPLRSLAGRRKSACREPSENGRSSRAAQALV